MKYPAGTIEARGKTYPVEVDDSGRWMVEFQGSTIWGDTKDKIRDQLMKATARAVVKVEVPFEKLVFQPSYANQPPKVVRGVATGIHAKTAKILVRWESGGTEQIDGYGNIEFFKPLSDDERVKVVELAEAERKAKKEYSTYTRLITFDVRSAVQKAIEEAVGEVPESDEF